MQMSFRIECPKCNWGHKWQNSIINQGWIKLHCVHCESDFLCKVTIPTVITEVKEVLPESKHGVYQKNIGEEI